GSQRLPLGALVDQPLSASLAVGGWQVQEGEVIAALVVGAVGAEGGVAFLVDEPRRGVGEAGAGILVGRDALRLEEQRPAVAEALEHVVEPRGDGDELGLCRAVQVGTTVSERALERAVLVENDAGSDQTGPGQVVAQADSLLAVFGEVQHRRAPLWRVWRDRTARKAGSWRVTHTATAWPASQIRRPASHRRRPRPMAAASVPLRIVKLRGAPAIRIGSVSARCSGTSKPGRDDGWPSMEITLRVSVDEGAAGEGEERQEERGGGEGDGEPEHHLHH